MAIRRPTKSAGDRAEGDLLLAFTEAGFHPPSTIPEAPAVSDCGDPFGGVAEQLGTRLVCGTVGAIPAPGAPAEELETERHISAPCLSANTTGRGPERRVSMIVFCVLTGAMENFLFVAEPIHSRRLLARDLASSLEGAVGRARVA